MKKTLNIIAAATLLAFTVTSCIIHVKPAKTSGKIIEKSFNIKDFNAVNIMSYADVIYVPGDHYSIKVKTSEEQMSDVKMEVEDSTLNIYYKEDWTPFDTQEDTQDGSYHKVTHFTTGNHDFKPVTIYITSPKLKDIRLGGSGSFECKDSLLADNLSIHLTGSGDIHLVKAYTKTANTEIVGSGDVKIDWLTADETSYSIFGSGSIKSKEFRTKKSQSDISGSGDISVDYTECLHADALISGSGNIYLAGHLESLNQNVSGSGEIHTESLKTKYSPTPTPPSEGE